MLKQIRHTFITLGIASGMTAGVLWHYASVDQCRITVLRDLEKHQQFQVKISAYQQTQDFLTELTKGGK